MHWTLDDHQNITRCFLLEDAHIFLIFSWTKMYLWGWEMQEILCWEWDHNLNTINNIESKKHFVIMTLQSKMVDTFIRINKCFMNCINTFWWYKAFENLMCTTWCWGANNSWINVKFKADWNHSSLNNWQPADSTLYSDYCLHTVHQPFILPLLG